MSSTGSRRTSWPILGSRSSPDRAMLEPGVSRYGWFVGLGVVVASWPYSILVPSAGRSGW